MPLKATIDSLEDLPEELHGHYAERDGKYYLDVEGLPTQESVTKLEGALSKVKAEKKQLGERLALLGDLKVEDALEQIARIPELEAAASGKVDDEKIQEMVEARLKAKLSPVEREKSTLKAKLDELTGVVGEYQQRERKRTITDAVREAIGKSDGFVRSAEEDALLLAERMLEVDEDGRVVTRDDAGVAAGIEPAAWLAEMQARKPHWWGPSSGGGATGNRGGAGAGPNPWSATGWNLTEQMRVIKESPQRAEQLAKAAGTTVDGQRPKG